MEDFQLDIVLGKGPAARSIRLDLPRFTLVGATTRTGLDHRPAARPLRPRGPARLLRRRRPRGDRRARRRHPRRRHRRRRRAGDRPPGPGHAPHRQPPAAPGARLRRGARRRRHRRGHRPRGPGRCSASTSAASTRSTGPSCRPCAERFGGGPGRASSHPGHQRGRADRDRRGRLRAVPHPAGPAHAHAPGPGGHAGGLGPPGPGRPAERAARRRPRPRPCSTARPARATPPSNWLWICTSRVVQIHNQFEAGVGPVRGCGVTGAGLTVRHGCSPLGPHRSTSCQPARSHHRERGGAPGRNSLADPAPRPVRPTASCHRGSSWSRDPLELAPAARAAVADSSGSRRRLPSRSGVALGASRLPAGSSRAARPPGVGRRPRPVRRRGSTRPGACPIITWSNSTGSG